MQVLILVLKDIIVDVVERLSERFLGNTSVDNTSMKFSPYVLYMTHIKF